jgi:probable F420-dependent oxidoreductase
MELGLVLPNSGPLASADAMYRIAEAAESLGFAALWTSDHLALPVASSASYPYVRGRDVRLDPSHAFVEPLIALAGVAARTQRIRLGVSVYLAALRHPLVAAKLVASLDQLSGGRVILGVGAGWIPEEYAAFGIPWRERGRVLDEHIACLRSLWADERPEHSGAYFSFGGLGFEPKPVLRRVPIWVGGNSRPAMRRASRLGDGWHVIDLSAAEMEQKLGELERLCAEHGRELSELTVSMRMQLALLRPEGEVMAELRALRALGVAHVALWPPLRGADVDAVLAHVRRSAEWIAALA